MENNKTNASARQNDSIQIKDFINLCLSNWYWFVISVAVCLLAGTLKILTTPAVFSRSATILIKESAARRSSNELEAMLTTGGLSQMNTKLANEIVAFTSPDLMREVVKRLNLEVDYYAPGRFKKQVLYSQSTPINVVFFDSSVPSKFFVSQEDGRFRVSEIKYTLDSKKYHDEDGFICAPGDTVTKDFGTFCINANPCFSGEWSNYVEVHHSSVKAATNMYSARVKADAVDMKNFSDLLELKISDQSTARAEDILNTLIAVYNENWVTDRNQIALSTSYFINDRLKTIEKELGSVDSDISSFKSRNLLPDLSTASSMFMAKSEKIEGQVQELNNQLIVVRSIRNQLSGTSGQNQLIPASTGIANAAITSQITNYNTMQLQRNNLAASSSEINPLVKDLDASLALMHESIIIALDNEIDNLHTQISQLQQTEQKTTARIADNPNQAKYLLTIERQQKVKETLYLFLLQKREENELSQAFSAYNTRVITNPTGPGNPTSPQKNRILAIAFLLGLCLPVGFFYLREIINDKVRGRKDIENMATPLLGEIPQYRESGLATLNDEVRKLKKLGKFNFKKNGQTPEVETILVKNGQRDAINEAFRVLRTNVEFVAGGENPSKVLAVTSFNAGSGKTFISINLATALAISGKSILVIDGDFRHASMSKLVGSPRKGFANYLAGEDIEVDSLLVGKDGIKNLSILPVGTIPPNPTELVNSPKFAEVVDFFRKNFDYVMIDCPPVEIVADTQIIEKVVDRTLFIIRAGLFVKSMIPELDAMANREEYKNIAVILNGTETQGSRYGYSYGYRYGYKYGHSKEDHYYAR